MSKNVAEQVVELIVTKFDIEATQIKMDSNFETDLGFDSLELVEFVMAVEEQFKVSIPDETAGAIKTVQQAIDRIEEAVQGR